MSPSPPPARHVHRIDCEHIYSRGQHTTERSLALAPVVRFLNFRCFARPPLPTSRFTVSSRDHATRAGGRHALENSSRHRFTVNHEDDNTAGSSDSSRDCFLHPRGVSSVVCPGRRVRIVAVLSSVASPRVLWFWFADCGFYHLPTGNRSIADQRDRLGSEAF